MSINSAIKLQKLYSARPRPIADTSLCSDQDKTVCLIYEFEITVDTSKKMMNGQNLDKSLDDGIDKLKGKKCQSSMVT